MRFAQTLRAGSAGLSLFMLSALAQGEAPPAAPGEVPTTAELSAELHRLRLELAEQRALLRQLREAMADGGVDAGVDGAGGARAAPDVDGWEAASAQGGGPAPRPLPPAALAALRGAGPAAQSQPLPALPLPGMPQQPGTQPGAQVTKAPAATRAPAVGQPPARDMRPPEVAPLFEAPGVLTARGRTVLEPSFQFGYSSSNRVALVGYTIIPALLIGLIDVREVKRNTFTAALAARRGLTNRTEVEVRVPYVYRSDSTVSRELFTGTAVERVFDTSGRALGDIELSLRHQLNDGGVDKPYYVAGLRVKTRTGRDPFEVVTDCTRRCVGENATGTGLPLGLPTGSGFYGVQPSITWLFPSDPAIFFGSISYLHNVKRNGVSRRVLNGETEPLGSVKPGAVIGFNFGIGVALNEKASLSLGYDHSSMGRTRQNGVNVPGSVRTQLGTLLMGFSYRLNDRRTVNVTVGAGLTRDTPDVSLSVRVPLGF
ncbi:acetate kinase [Pseudoduganella umbonata]|uniref:Acetate kinase n=1 Tax=Pseudoduganella umbonata TaxID=864828 RepID=A0A4P8HM96_9BURK|nr:acetate kinase [Pseudoduganella umbonata]MBB3219379.1 opacity protein-like surface antigen [Pseudoduganella umbonata]QCP09472.1 acetate kinase [Pseudoduganella umbonata]